MVTYFFLVPLVYIIPDKISDLFKVSGLANVVLSVGVIVLLMSYILMPLFRKFYFQVLLNTLRMNVFLTCLALWAILFNLSDAFGKEGADQYNLGSSDSMAGILPPKGSYLLNYSGHYSANLVSKDGEKIDGVGLDLSFTTFRYVFVPGYKLLGGRVAFHAILPVIKQKFRTPTRKKSTLGIGDSIFSPLSIGWDFGDFYIVGAIDVYVPTGKWNMSDPLSRIGANYYSFEPVVAATYSFSNSWEVSSKIMYNVKTKNKDTNYLSGDEIKIEGAVSKDLGLLSVGLSGYHTNQISSDKLNGLNAPSSLQRGSALGAQLRHNFKGTVGVLKFHREFKSKNRFEGNKFQIKLIFPF